MRVQTTLVIFTACWLSCPLTARAGSPTASAPPASTMASTTATNDTPAANSVTEFRDQHGKTLSSDQFAAAVKKGQHFSTKEDLQAGKILMTLLPPGVTTPGSQSWADMTTSGTTLIEVRGVHYLVVFHDVRGKVINQKAFAAGAARQQRYTTRLDEHRKLAVLTLLPLGKKPSGSQPVSDWTVESSSAAPIPEPGTIFPAFDLPKVGGGRLNTASSQGKPYVVDFFFAQCIGCIAELPTLNAYHKQYPERPLVAITFDDARTAADFVQQRHFDWPVTYAGKAFTDKLGLKVYPTMVVVGADGKVLATRVGSDDSATPEKLEAWVAASIHDAHAHTAAH